LGRSFRRKGNDLVPQSEITGVGALDSGELARDQLADASWAQIDRRGIRKRVLALGRRALARRYDLLHFSIAPQRPSIPAF
jgi:hypothetical protein